ncbi:portal (connector) protein [Agrobacterium phage OLIVR2]|uniref:Portal (Connector) protein n=1 Tax=Agrobacterium phage OLIVR1 TaxID=2723769 RepID=A0A858MU58_9CAUD|nr:hypothetical protein [Xanthomonas campestris]YP_010107129.1 portal protein [Agrobacterium phage OLIVR1]QIW87397.1 portal (connector) protein [Agrobacterium phage OLIVR2]QIW87504.1 portal (connector) protein [Agrobacterium phage OLIVR3]MCF8861595.1 hypothetical protein [Xanthomonas campestris pv. campestris]QIW87290.1 portal (connector) protein [Agrobacterium phage OLIVR1]
MAKVVVTEKALGPESAELNPVEAPKLTDWANEPNIMKLQGDLDMSKSAHDTHSTKVSGWNDLMKVRGKAKPKSMKGRSSIQPKLIRRQAEWRYAALSEPFLGSDKLYQVKPATFEDRKGANQNDIVLNWQWRTKISRVKFIDEYVRTAVDEGSVIVRTGWTRITKMVKEVVPVWGYMEPQEDQQVEMIQQAMTLRDENPREYDESVSDDVKEAIRYFEETGTVVIAIQVGQQEVDVEKVVENRPNVSIVNPHNFYVDPSCEGDIDKANFAIVSFETSQADMLKEPDRYKNLQYVNWEMATPLVNPDHESQTPQDSNFQDRLRKRVVAFEYWGFYDIHGTGELVPIVATWVGGAIVRMEENPFPDKKLPFVIETYMPVKRELMGEPDAEILGDNQAVLGAVMRGMIDLMGRSANSQQGFAKGMLDSLNRRKFDAGLDYEFNPTTNPNLGHVEHKYPEIPQSAMLMVTMQNQEAESLSGVKAFAGGMSGEAFGDVAAGIRGVLDASSKREMGILRRLANGIKRIGDKIIAMNAVFLSEEEVVRVTNDEFVTVKREDLIGNFDLIVDISTAEVDNKKAQDLAFMLQTMGNTVDFGMVKIILVEIAKLQRMPDLAKMLEKFEPQPDPIEQQLKQLAVMKAQKEIELLDSEIALNVAKAETERAKANQQDLDTVEQETGTKHERELEKQAGQARGNQALEVTKSLLKPRKQANGQETKPDIEAAVGFNELSKNSNSNNNRPADTTLARDALAARDPSYSLGSQFYDPSLDPASNPAINITG